MVAWIKSFENSLQNVLAEEETQNQSYLKTLTSPPRSPTVQNLQEDLACSEHEKPHIKRLWFLLRLSDMGLCLMSVLKKISSRKLRGNKRILLKLLHMTYATTATIYSL